MVFVVVPAALMLLLGVVRPHHTREKSAHDGAIDSEN
jgi:hypothetical protein